ncbi:MAG: hypothetical protein HUJ51_02685 [Eggerthellaceae bacterium]|nr:hypothetical protein [Eggerthellaceae bacterium]
MNGKTAGFTALAKKGFIFNGYYKQLLGSLAPITGKGLLVTVDEIIL